MAEQKTTQQQVREQFKVAENGFQNALRVWNDMISTTTEWTFDLAERGLRYNQELLGQNERALNETLVTYRGLYRDGMKTYQGYVQSFNDLMTRSL
jgi:hypothetical protein